MNLPDITSRADETDQMPSQQDSKKTSVVEAICGKIRQHGLSPKQFFQQFLTSKEESIIIRRKQWISSSGWSSTEKILNSIKKLVDDENTRVAQGDWE